MCSSPGRSTLLTTTRTGTSPPRSVFASSASPARRRRPAVDDEQDRVGLGDPDPRLALHVLGQLALVGEVDAAGVEQLEGDPVPLAGNALAVAGDARARRG